MKILINKVVLIIRTILGTTIIKQIYYLMIHREFAFRKINHQNPINKNSFLNGFSENEEDSITIQILNRIGLKKGFFIEFGVGNGLENNTIILLAAGWNGTWFGGQKLAFDTSNSKKLTFKKVWITRENILKLYSSLNYEADLISLDVDGNDFYLAEDLLKNKIKPKVFIVEYNSKFPPEIDFKINYNPDHNWNRDDYYGASLKTFNTLFTNFGYRLVSCNLSGGNAFFVDRQFSKYFEDIPDDLSLLYNEPSYFLSNKNKHPTSIKTLTRIIND